MVKNADILGNILESEPRSAYDNFTIRTREMSGVLPMLS
jgi:hypothetical protein